LFEFERDPLRFWEVEMTKDVDAMRVGKAVAELCRAGKNMEAVESYYAANVVSIEPMGDEHMPARIDGIEAIRKKHHWWYENVQVHSGEVGGPYPHGNRFILTFKMDVTNKGGPMAGKRMMLEECALYTVKDGKIVHEEFFYDMEM
jgi:hypothetical protein